MSNPKRTPPSEPAGRAPVVTLDGPTGSGKGTVGEELATRLGWHYLDSGALYRAVGLAAMQAQCRPTDAGGIARVARDLNIQFEPQSGTPARVILDGEDVSELIRTEETGRLASQVAVLAEVRRALLEKQHVLRRPPGLVADGRDMGTVVFPGAVLKIFLTASPEARAERRYKQLKEKGLDVNLARLAEEIRVRDARDAEREASPLKPAEDACIVDTSRLTIIEVVERILGLLSDRLKK